MTLRTFLDGLIFGEVLEGPGPTVVALHGWGRDRKDLLPALAGCSIVALDLPGFGSSPPPEKAWTTLDYAHAVAGVIEELGHDRVVVVGHSFGGRVAAHLAATRPDLVRGVVFIGVPLLRSTGGSRPPLGYRLVKLARRLHLVSPRRVESARMRYGSIDYRAAQGVMRDVLVKAVNEDYEDQLKAIACPVAFVWGADDAAAPASIVEAAAPLVQHAASIIVVDGVGHDVHRDSIDAVRQALHGVLQVSA